MSGGLQFTDEQLSRPSADVSWLQPWNRRVRHLHRVVVRNLHNSLDESAVTECLDDDAVPRSTSSGDILPTHAEDADILRSHSSDNVRLTPPLAFRSDKSSKARPRHAAMRRRSTMDWARATTHQKQARLRDLTSDRLSDTFYTLHVRGIKGRYVSEVIHRTMNPDFQHVDLSTCEPYVKRSSRLTIMIWVGDKSASTFSVVKTVHTDLGSMTYIGNTPDFSTPSKSHNHVMIQLTDGYYAIEQPTNSDTVSAEKLAIPSRRELDRALPTSTFDSLLRLSKLDESIQDSLALRDKLVTDLNKAVQASEPALADQDSLLQKRDMTKTITYAKDKVAKQLQAFRLARDSKRRALAQLKAMIAQGRKDHTNPASLKGPPDFTVHVTEDVTRQRRRVCETVQSIYPILPIPNRSLSFKIRGLYLPNSDDLDESSPEVVAAALGFVAHAVQLLSFYLDQPLPYPISVNGSLSTIRDDISLIKDLGSTRAQSRAAQSNTHNDTSRIFPLSSRSGPRFRFDYGLFLLNKDIEVLLSRTFHIRVLDIRQTLPNLLYALYCATAGEGELPARKAGGIRGLCMGSIGSTFVEHKPVSDDRDEVPIESFRFGSVERKRVSRLAMHKEQRGTL